jgi:hypothetical protein
MKSSEHGIAVIVAMMGMLMMSALAVALVLGTSSETLIVRNFQTAGSAVYAADALLRYALDELASMPDWSVVLDGSTRSNRTDGLPAGERRLPDGSRVDLTERVNLANCGKLTTCSDADMDQITAERPWGANNPRWRPLPTARSPTSRRRRAALASISFCSSRMTRPRLTATRQLTRPTRVPAQA